MNLHSLVNSSALTQRITIGAPTTAWLGHIPFGSWLVNAVRPQCLVELGTHYGDSYFAFCNSVQKNDLITRCYAVDTWQGDEHAGKYPDAVYNLVKGHHDQHYSAFSSLLRMTFDDALGQFSDGSVDLLHIDGLHTYDAVRHDFESWLPKLSTQAVVLFHDTNVREGDFGVWRLWDELSVKYPSIHFDHSHGLGVLFVGENQPTVIHDLLNEWSIPDQRNSLCQFFAKLGQCIQYDWQITALKQRAAMQDEQILNLHHTVGERDTRVNHLTQTLEAQTASCEQLSQDLQAQLLEITQSKSWRITAPLRKTHHCIKKLLKRTNNQA
ncbi:class I SAM-dependent methyltransferase [Alcaligenaceae bacterium]|nr:class I SAM-dependent methyltransferase [Alcaligenaceae bacterium]